jgi:hypothetical protein
MKRKLSIMFILLFSFTTVAYGQITWYSLKEGREQAIKERKPMFIDFFYGKGCPRCEQMEKELYENPEIAKRIMTDFIPIRIDLTGRLTEEEEALGNLYDFKHDCLLLILDPEGKPITTKGGIRLCFVDALRIGDFLRYLEEIK